MVLLQPAVTHLDGIIENNKLQTWQKTLENFSLATLCMQCGALHVYDAYLGKCCVDREFYVNEGYGRVEMHPLKLIFNISMV